MGNNGKYGVCTKCLRRTNLTTHHELPRRFFDGEGAIIMLCRKCHDKIETIIPNEKKLEKKDYRQITKNFLENRFIFSKKKNGRKEKKNGRKKNGRR